jgi:hypothetical protein
VRLLGSARDYEWISVRVHIHHLVATKSPLLRLRY